ncbi:hypothetical protein AAFP30_15215 [Gordonia sp. CPCC 205515]|uniref:hypothetical protein n=1 Tax=Gordonia sp. CPCC 205515 TaxID=3140791 RepID=UPI003AF3F0AC
MSEPPSVPPTGGPEPSNQSYPPPQPGYGPGYPPPPHPGYGYPPSQPAPGQYPPGQYPTGQYAAGPPPGSPYPPNDPTKLDFGKAFSWSWDRFRDNLWPMLLPGILMFVAVLVFGGLMIPAGIWAFSNLETTTDAYGYSTTTGSVNAGGLLLMVLLGILLTIALIYLYMAVYAGSIRTVNGEPVTNRTFLTTIRFWPLLGTMILVGIVVTIGLILCIIPGLIAMVLLQFAPFFVVDRKMGPIAAMSASSQLVRQRVGDSVLVFIAIYGINYLGQALLYIGSIFTMPFTALLHAYSYRRMSGAPIAYDTAVQPGWPTTPPGAAPQYGAQYPPNPPYPPQNPPQQYGPGSYGPPS